MVGVAFYIPLTHSVSPARASARNSDIYLPAWHLHMVSSQTSHSQNWAPDPMPLPYGLFPFLAKTTIIPPVAKAKDLFLSQSIPLVDPQNTFLSISFHFYSFHHSLRHYHFSPGLQPSLSGSSPYHQSCSCYDWFSTWHPGKSFKNVFILCYFPAQNLSLSSHRCLESNPHSFPWPVRPCLGDAHGWGELEFDGRIGIVTLFESWCYNWPLVGRVRNARCPTVAGWAFILPIDH